MAFDPNNSKTQKLQIGKSGTVAGTRREINFIEGSNVSLTVTDNSGSDRVDVTIASTGGGATTVEGLSDTTFTALTSGEVLRYNGSAWVNDNFDNALGDSVNFGTLDGTVADHVADLANPHETTADQVLPDQTGNSGKYLTTNGTTASWGTVSGSSTGDVSASSNFGTDNVMIRSDGTGKGVQGSGNTIDDSNNTFVAGHGRFRGNIDSGTTDHGLFVGEDATGPRVLFASGTSNDNMYIYQGGTSLFVGGTTLGTRITLAPSGNTIAGATTFSSNVTLANSTNLTAVSEPSAPSSDKLALFARTVSGRNMPQAKSPSGSAFTLQPSFFEKSIFLLVPGSSTSFTALGGTFASTGTVTQPTVTQTYGLMSNFASGAVSGNTAGVSESSATFLIGSTAGSNGFFFFTRVAFSESASMRAFIGMSNQTFTATVAADDPGGHHAGFSWSTARGDTGWKFSTKDNVTQTLSSALSVNLVLAHVYDFYIYCAPQGTTLYYRVDDLTAGTSAEGSTGTTLPGNTTLLRGGIQIATLEAVAKNLRMQKIYIESDR